MTRAGTLTVVGRPNAGKSTLLNRIIGQKLSITSEKPQTTRDRIVGIRTGDDVQMLVLDTPGLLEPRYLLHTSMRQAALRALRDADVLLYVVDATDGPPESLQQLATLSHPPSAAQIVTMNKVDLLSAEQRRSLEALMPEARFISAVTGDGVEALMQDAGALLPPGPFLYPSDEISTQPVRFFTAELIRETALEQLSDEVPYSVACEIEEFRESGSPVYIRAVLFVERDSQKGILVGAGGARVRDLGKAARTKIETLIGSPVYLDLWVKVLPNWRKRQGALRRLGYHLEQHDQS